MPKDSRPTEDLRRSVADVYAAELDYIVERRRRLGDKDVDASTLQTERQRAGTAIAPRVAHGTVGLALSGGGIRSATFSLGVLQALAHLDLLKFVDYLSTVSGGGYVGSCVTSLLTSDPRAGVRPAGREPGAFPLGFTGADREAPEVRHLRDYSNYLVPRRGILSLGVWRLVAAYLGALALNLIAPLSGLAFLFVAGTLILSWLAAAQWAWGWSYLRWLAAGLGLVAAVWLVVLYFAGWTKRARDILMAGAARTVAVAMALGFLIAAPWAYYQLVGLVLGSQPVALGDLDGGLKVFGFCKGPAPRECQQVEGIVEDLRDALRVAGARVGRGQTTLQHLVDGIWDTQLTIANKGLAGDLYFAGPEVELIRALGEAGFTIGEGGALDSLVTVIFPILAAAIPAAIIGYLKRSLWIFGFATAGLLAAVEIVHLGEWLSREHYPMLVEWYPRFLVIAIVSGFVINVNRVSLLNFYRDRLADAYMIRRSSAQITTSDQIRLRDVLPTSNGPYHLVNATLNLSGSRDLSLRGRRAAHFLFSKLYCGSPRVGYAPTSAYARGRLELATAMAVSGAAVSPQMGSATKPGLAVLMALLNIRLGQWLPNPAVRLRAGLVFWNYFFVKELFSLTDENDWYVFVSDGGHFDNTGLYGLLERRCKTIIAVDCGGDPTRKFQDIANIMRKARIDFGIDIQLDLGKLHGDATSRRAAAGFQVGKIFYPPNQGDVAGEGRLVYIKPTMSEDLHESEDLLEYARNHSTFPQETTGDQFFDEGQFESYRELGYQLTKAGFAALGSRWLR